MKYWGNTRRVSGATRLCFVYVMFSALICPGLALAAEPVGEWLVAERTARIRIVDCGGSLWGVVSWEADPGFDTKNPSPEKRDRPILGMPVLLSMEATGQNRWSGRIYNSENGKTYAGGVRLIEPDLLRVRGCILGFLCGGENWTRADPEENDPLAATDSDICSRIVEMP